MSTATWTDRAPGQERALGHWAWPATLSFALLLAIVSGGSSQADSWAFLLFRLICIGILGVALVYELSTGALDWGIKTRTGRSDNHLHPEEER